MSNAKSTIFTWFLLSLSIVSIGVSYTYESIGGFLFSLVSSFIVGLVLIKKYEQ